jgi:hypothetical protein
MRQGFQPLADCRSVRISVEISDCRCATVGSCVNIKLEQCAIARNAFQGHSLPILDLSVTFTEKQESLNDPN